MKRLRNLLIALTLVVGLGAVTLPAVTYADGAGDACQAIGADQDCNAPKGSVSISSIVKTVVSILSIAVGIAAVIMIIIAGLKYVTASGDSNKVSSAKNTLIFAIVGLAVAALAQVIVQFVFRQITATPAAPNPNASKVDTKNGKKAV